MSGIIGDNVGRGSGAIVAAGGGGLESGTKTDFFQASAPTDWTQDATNNDKMLRVVSGTGGGTGGTAAISSPAHTITAAAHTLATSETPAHTHTVTKTYNSSYHNTRVGGGYSADSESQFATSSTGGGGSHTHSGTGSITTPAYMDVIIATKD